MNCSELRDHVELYSLGLAEEPERSEIRAHLDRGCEVCMTEVKRARELAAPLASTAAPLAPSPKLPRRIPTAAGAQPYGFGWAVALAAVAALSLCAAVYFSGREREFSQEARSLLAQTRSQNIQLTRLTEAFAILNGADTTVTSFGEKQPKPKGRVFVNPSQGILLIASNLAVAPEGKAYEMWVIPKGGKAPVAAGMFQARDDGTAMHVHLGALDVSAAAAVAVTLEEAAGASAPTTTPVIVAALQ
jgi:anti-sigma-K factor RskA